MLKDLSSPYISIIIAICLILVILIKKYYKTKQEEDIKNPITTSYNLKSLMTPSEYSFYLKLKKLENNYIIHPQLNLATIINKTSNGSRYASELFRNIDFAIFTKNYSELLLLIELNDSSHNQYERKKRDFKVKKICNSMNIQLMTFYTNYPNEENYVYNRVISAIEKEHKKEEEIETIPLP